MAGSCGSPSYSRIPQVQTFRFATINLFTRFVDPGHLARVLDEVQPDLMVAVEMAPKAADVIADHFEHHHLVPDPHFMGWGVAGRYDMTADEDVSWLGRGGALRVQLPGTVLHLAAIHLYDPLFGNPIDLARKRRQQVEALLDWGDRLPAAEPQLLAGDFNATPIWKAYRRLAGRWPDLVSASPSGPRRTWGFPRGLRLLRIDHILGTGLEATAARVVRVRDSDHHMVVADLRLL